MNVLGKTRLFHYVDDTLGVVHTHMVTGFLGGFLTGIFATAEGVAAFATAAPGGAVAGKFHHSISLTYQNLTLL